MTQNAWTSPEPAYGEPPRSDQMKKSPQSAPTLGGWINSVMPERSESGQYQSAGYGVPIQNMPMQNMQVQGMPMNSMPMQQSGYSQPVTQPTAGLDIHGIYQRLDDLAGTISRMEKGQTRAQSTPVYSGMATYSGQNRRSEESQNYSGTPRRNDDFNPYARQDLSYRASASSQNPEMISQLIMRVEDAERQAREAWRAANNVMVSAQKSGSKLDSSASESAINRAERILAAADETARKTLALLNIKQGEASMQPKASSEVQVVAQDKETQSGASDQLAAQLSAIESRLALLLEEKSSSHPQHDQSQAGDQLAAHLSSIETRLESLLEEKLSVHAVQPDQIKNEQLAGQLNSIESRLESLLEEKLSAHNGRAEQDGNEILAGQLNSIESRLESLLEEKLSAHNGRAEQDGNEVLAGQLKSIELRLESLLNQKIDRDENDQEKSVEGAAHSDKIQQLLELVMAEKAAAQAQSGDSQASEQLASKLSAIEARLEDVLAEKFNLEQLKSQSEGQMQDDKFNALFDRMDGVGSKLQSLSDDLELLKSQTVSVSEKTVDESRIAAIVHQSFAGNKIGDEQANEMQEVHIQEVKSQISKLSQEFEHARLEDSQVLAKLSEEITSIRELDGQDSQVLDKLFKEISGIRQQDAIVFNEIEDISARLEDQIKALHEQITMPVPQQPVMEALEDIYTKIESLNAVIDKDTQDDVYAVVHQQLQAIQLANDSSEEEVLGKLQEMYAQIEGLAHIITDLKNNPQMDEALVSQLEGYMQEFSNNLSFSTQNSQSAQKEFQEHLQSIRSSVTTLDQRFIVLLDVMEATSQSLKEQKSVSGSNDQLNELLQKIDTLQEKLIDAPARMGLASMEYQLHALENKIDGMGDQDSDGAQVQMLQGEIQSLKSVIEKATDTSGISRLEREIADIHHLLLATPAQPSNRYMGDMMGAIARVEMGLTQVIQNNSMDSLLRAFDQINKSFQDQRSTQEKQSRVMLNQLNSALEQHNVDQEKLSQSLLDQMGELKHKLDSTSSEVQVASLNSTIKQLNEEIRAEIAALASQDALKEVSSTVAKMSGGVMDLSGAMDEVSGSVNAMSQNFDHINGIVSSLGSSVSSMNMEIHGMSDHVQELSGLPKSIDILASALQERFRILESQVNEDLPARLSDILQNQQLDMSAFTMPEDSLNHVRIELSNLRHTIEQFVVSQKEAQYQAAAQAKAQVMNEAPQQPAYAARAVSDSQSVLYQNNTSEAIGSSNIHSGMKSEDSAVFIDELPEILSVNMDSDYVPSAIEQALAPVLARNDDAEDFSDTVRMYTPQSSAVFVDDMPEMMIKPAANESENKHDFIAAARKAAQAAAAEASSSSLSFRTRRSQEQDPFQQDTAQDEKSSALVEKGKSLFSKFGLGGAKPPKPQIIPAKSDHNDYVAPSLAEDYMDDEMLEPGEAQRSSAMKKTLLMSASAAVLAAGTFGYFASNTLNDQTAAIDGDSWLKNDMTSSLPAGPQSIGDDYSSSAMPTLPALNSQQDVNSLFESSGQIVKPSSDQASNHFSPYETIGGIPIPPSLAGQKSAALSAGQLQTPADKAKTLAGLQFPMPIEALGSQKLRTAAAQGNPAALLEVANRYAEGRGVARDMNEAVVWFTRAANLGSAPAQYRLGSFYEKGYGVSKDLKLAAQWYEKSALVGNRKSMHNLAVLYAEGYQGKPNFEMSLKWFREAAERGLSDSQYNLGVIYARGLGVKQDLVEAYKWFAIAAEAGDAEAAKKRDEVAAKMDPKMVHWAKSAVRLFQPKDLDPMVNDGQMQFETWDEMPAGKVSAVQQLKRAA